MKVNDAAFLSSLLVHWRRAGFLLLQKPASRNRSLCCSGQWFCPEGRNIPLPVGVRFNDCIVQSSYSRYEAEAIDEDTETRLLINILSRKNS